MSRHSPILSARQAGAARIAIIYLIFGTLWILFSDTIAGSLIQSPTLLVWASMIKGWLYMLVTAGLLLLLILRHTADLARSEDRSKRLARFYQTLSETNQILVRADDEIRLFQQICDTLLELSDFRVAWIGRHDPERNSIIPRAGAGQNASVLLEGASFPLQVEAPGGVSLAARCFREGLPQVNNDYRSEQDLSYWQNHAAFREVRSACCLPISMNNQTTGVLGIGSPHPQYFDDEILTHLAKMALDISFGLEMLARAEALRSTLLDLQQAHEETRRWNTELEARVAERTQQYHEANKDLEAFAYSVSHDLRAPLRAIDGYARILMEEEGDSLDIEGKRVMNVLLDETLRMGHLIDSLLSFSRLGRSAINIERVDMRALALSAWEELQAADPGQTAEFHLTEIPSCRGDIGLLRQVWTNLLSNARKFSAKRDHPVISVDATTSDEETVYLVKDNGVGFSMTQSHRLFGVFQRLHSDTEFAGTGAGLAIVQRIVHRHGGWIRAESAPDAGATFSFALPVT